MTTRIAPDTAEIAQAVERFSKDNGALIERLEEELHATRTHANELQSALDLSRGRQNAAEVLLIQLQKQTLPTP